MKLSLRINELEKEDHGEIQPKCLQKKFRYSDAIKDILRSCKENMESLIYRFGAKVIGGKHRDMQYLTHSSLKYYYPVTQPLILISQIQRSGGTLLTQLFDGHPELYAHPYELKIGHPDKYMWPNIDLTDPHAKWFDMLSENYLSQFLLEGYNKLANKRKSNGDSYYFPFLPTLQKELFIDYLGSMDNVSLRDIFDGYHTSFFNAWLNRQNIHAEKKYVTGFVPLMSMSEHNMEQFFNVYPDGYLFSIIREPGSWYASAKKLKKSFDGIDESINIWCKSIKAMVRNKKKYRDRMVMLRFEDLLLNSESVMKYISKHIGIKFDPIIVTPTFNGNPIRANSSFTQDKYGIISEPLTRGADLSKIEINTIDEIANKLYMDALNLVDTIPAYRHPKLFQ